MLHAPQEIHLSQPENMLPSGVGRTKNLLAKQAEQGHAQPASLAMLSLRISFFCPAPLESLFAGLLVTNKLMGLF